MGRQVLISFSSDYIVNFILNNPVSTIDGNLTNRNTIGGDIMPPIAGVEIFLEAIKRLGHLLTEDEYANFYLHKLDERFGPEWNNVLAGCQKKYNRENLPLADYIEKRREAFRLRAKRNFYVSMIDTLHAWSLLLEAKWYDICYIDSVKDVYAKTDLTLVKDSQSITIALYGPFSGKDHFDYKKKYRSNGIDYTCIHEFRMPPNRRKKGNKRWYELSDFNPIKPFSENDTCDHDWQALAISPSEYYARFEAYLNELHHSPYIND